MASPRPLTLPDHLLSDRRQDWSLAELVAHWAAQGVPATDVLGHSWDLLDEPDRPDGLSYDRGSSTGMHLVCGRYSRMAPGALVKMMIITKKFGLRMEDVAPDLWLKRELAAWLIARLNGQA